jgi:predicted Zn-dependent protease with MMP-like domain
MTRERFEILVEEAIKSIPGRFRVRMKNLAVVVEDEPPSDLLEDLEIDPDDTLFGLYQGTPLTERQFGDGNRLPDRITIFQGPIERECEDEDEIVGAVAETVIHELGHYFGLSEAEIQAIEERYWRGEPQE